MLAVDQPLPRGLPIDLPGIRQARWQRKKAPSSPIPWRSRSREYWTSTASPGSTSRTSLSVLRRDENGKVREALTPDFFLPEIGSYIECTVMRQSQTTRKNRKVRLAQQLHGVVITLLYRRDLARLGLWACQTESVEP